MVWQILSRRHPAPQRRVAPWIFGLLVLLLASPAAAQSLGLRDMLTQFLRQGMTLAPPPEGVSHEAHFTGDDSPQFQALNQLNTEIGRRLSSFPLSSSAGGFAYELDPELGVLSRPTESFGPVYAERPLTLGKGKYNIGLSVADYSFDTMDGLNLREGDMKLVFTHIDPGHDGPLVPELEGDLILAQLFISIETTVQTLVASYGVRDDLDIGIAIPVMDVNLEMSANAEIERLATGDRGIHTFLNGTNHDTFGQKGHADGVGDVLLRGKYRFFHQGRNYLALAGDLRLPTGDETNLLGTGEVQGKVSLLASIVDKTFSPHVNLGYGMSGGDLPNEFLYTTGFSWAADPKLTLSADLIGRSLFDVKRLWVADAEFQYVDLGEVGGEILTTRQPRLNLGAGETKNLLNGSVGFKLNVVGSFLLTANGLFPLTNDGLNDDFAGLLGVDYSF